MEKRRTVKISVPDYLRSQHLMKICRSIGLLKFEMVVYSNKSYSEIKCVQHLVLSAVQTAILGLTKT